MSSTAEALAQPKVPTVPLLVATGVRRRFGGVVAVDVDHFEVARGSITALIGPNGAGKTTFFNLLTGFDKPDEGRWTFDGEELTGRSAYEVARAGMVRTFQLTKALARMTVLDNVMLAAPRQQGERMLLAPWRWVWRSREREVRERAEALLDHVGLLRLKDQYAGTLSGGQRKLLELARALMAEPKMVMLDEPMAGVNPALTQFLLERILELKDNGLTVLFVEHDMVVVRTISDRVVCMAEGRVIAEGTADEVSTNPLVIDAYLGGTHEDVDAATIAAIEEEASQHLFQPPAAGESPSGPEGEVSGA